jgi:hypothetical protein
LVIHITILIHFIDFSLQITKKGWSVSDVI